MARNWSNHKYGLDEVLRISPVKYGEIHEFPQLLSPEAIKGGVDFQDCCATAFPACLLRVGVSWGIGIQFLGDSVHICSVHTAWGHLRVGLTVASKKSCGLPCRTSHFEFVDDLGLVDDSRLVDDHRFRRWFRA